MNPMFPKLPNDPDFDREFNAMGRRIRQTGTAIAVWGVFSTLLGLAFLGLLIYVAHHFLMKVW